MLIRRWRSSFSASERFRIEGLAVLGVQKFEVESSKTLTQS